MREHDATAGPIVVVTGGGGCRQFRRGDGRERNARVKVGIAGWNFAPWRDNFYPKGLPQRRELEFASRHLATIEINSTFYHAQTPKVYAKWRDETPPGFVFSLKA